MKDEQVVKAINSKPYRKLKGITQEDMAKELGVSTLTIIQWEQGKCLPNADRLYRMSMMLGVTMEALCLWEK